MIDDPIPIQLRSLISTSPEILTPGEICTPLPKEESCSILEEEFIIPPKPITTLDWITELANTTVPELITADGEI